MVSAKSSTRAGGLVRAVTGIRPTSMGAIHAIAAMSSRTREDTVRRWTLTATRSPDRRVAACTWAIDADATGVRSKETKTSASGRPRSSSTVRRTVENGSGGTRSRRRRNSSTSSSGKMPSPEEMICPSLMYVGPRRSNAGRSRRESPARDRSVPRSRRPQARSAPPSRNPTARTRVSDGRCSGRVSRWASAAAPRRSASMSPPASTGKRHSMVAGSTLQGPCGLNAPMLRSESSVSEVPAGVRPRTRGPLRGGDVRSRAGRSVMVPQR